MNTSSCEDYRTDSEVEEDSYYLSERISITQALMMAKNKEEIEFLMQESKKLDEQREDQTKRRQKRMEQKESLQREVLSQFQGGNISQNQIKRWYFK